MKDYLKQINKAKMALFNQRNTTFFSSLLAKLKLEFTDQIPTAATNGISLLINPKFIENMPIDELIGLLLHEVMHCVYDHMDRAKMHKLDPTVWNIAADYLINGELDILGYKLPKTDLLDHKWDGMGTQEIYDQLIQQTNQPTLPMADLMCNAPEGMSESEHRETILTNVVQAVTQARMDNDPGSIPGHVARRVEEIVNPKLPWNAILQNYLSVYAKEEYTWTRPNKRYWPDIYLPSMRSESLDQITVGVDVSGSITQQDLDIFIAEIRYIWDFLKPKALRIIAFDTHIRFDETYSEGDSIDNIHIPGGGGTLIGPILDSIRDDTPELAIIFSDMEFSMPYLDDISSDLIWIRIGEYSFNPSKGTVIDYD
jgi:predicted metal-dependent peptidase